MAKWKGLTRRQRRLSRFWLSRHLDAAIKAADATRPEVAAQAGVSPRLVSDILKEGADELPLLGVRAGQAALVSSLEEWAEGWVGCSVRRMQSDDPCPLCPRDPPEPHSRARTPKPKPR